MSAIRIPPIHLQFHALRSPTVATFAGLTRVCLFVPKCSSNTKLCSHVKTKMKTSTLIILYLPFPFVAQLV